MSRNKEDIKESFELFFEVMEKLDGWKESELRAKIIELNTKHLLDNLDKSLIQFKESDKIKGN